MRSIWWWWWWQNSFLFFCLFTNKFFSNDKNLNEIINKQKKITILSCCFRLFWNLFSFQKKKLFILLTLYNLQSFNMLIEQTKKKQISISSISHRYMCQCVCVCVCVVPIELIKFGFDFLFSWYSIQFLSFFLTVVMLNSCCCLQLDSIYNHITKKKDKLFYNFFFYTYILFTIDNDVTEWMNEWKKN